ncbi:PEP-CTERM sorting domain-containing protein [Edaphobacter sp. HDX4]|uniref:DVUA0089 family protein n=1 Tax=Edaphobacter sp. HDX4 TaxID=2794064 RepID=UPI002FE6328D
MRASKVLIAACVFALSSAVSHADDFSFTGTFNSINDVQLFTFTVGASSNVVLRTWSYAGGVNAQGQTIAAGGFDPILALFQGTGSSAVYIGQNDDGGSAVPADPVTGAHFDTYLAQNSLAPGDYTVSIMDYANFATGPTLGDGFTGGALVDSDCSIGTGTFCDATNHFRDSHWAFDILGVEAATTPDQPPTSPVPEPSTIALLGSGLLGMAQFARRRFSL